MGICCIEKTMEDWDYAKQDEDTQPSNLKFYTDDLSVRMLANIVYEGEGGRYYVWCPKEHPVLKELNIGAAKLVLSTNGFALPCYSDSAKVAYVLQGGGVAGVVLPGEEEKVIAIRKGDAIALPVGVVTWWYNKDATELEILFLGDTKTAVNSGSFTDVLLTGPNGNFSRFSPDFVGRALKSEGSVLKFLVGPQLANSIVKLDLGFEMPDPKQDHRDSIMLFNCEEAEPSHFDINGGGEVVVLNSKNLPMIGNTGLGANYVALNGSAMYYPEVSLDSAIRVTYFVKGSGRVKVLDVDELAVDRRIEAGELFVVPRLYHVLNIADPDGLEWFAITNQKSNSQSLDHWGLSMEASIARSSSSPGCS